MNTHFWMNNIYILSLGNLNLVAKYILRKKNIFSPSFSGNEERSTSRCDLAAQKKNKKKINKVEHLDLSGKQMLSSWRMLPRLFCRSYGLCNCLIWIEIYMELSSLMTWEFIIFKQLFRASNLFVIYILFSSKTLVLWK